MLMMKIHKGPKDLEQWTDPSSRCLVGNARKQESICDKMCRSGNTVVLPLQSLPKVSPPLVCSNHLQAHGIDLSKSWVSNFPLIAECPNVCANCGETDFMAFSWHVWESLVSPKIRQRLRTTHGSQSEACRRKNWSPQPTKKSASQHHDWNCTSQLTLLICAACLQK